MAKVVLCIPHGGSVHPEFYRHLLIMQNATPQHQFTYCELDMMLVGKARNDLVKLALSISPDVVWFVDDDVLVPPHSGTLVDEARSLGVVAGLYFNRRIPYVPQLYTLATEPEYKGKKMYWPVTDYPEGLMVVDAVGAGCLTIRADIFQDL